jgi:hypothetical protein
MTTKTLLAAAMTALVAGCGPNGNSGPGSASTTPRPTATASSPKVDKAVAITRDLEGNDQADQVLQKHGMTEQQFEDLMYEIASDPVMSEQYAAKLGR